MASVPPLRARSMIISVKESDHLFSSDMPLFVHRVMQNANNEYVIAFNEVIDHMALVMMATHAGVQKADIPTHMWCKDKVLQAVA